MKPDSETGIALDAASIDFVNPPTDPGLRFCKLTGAWESSSAEIWNYHDAVDRV